jgi:hypothetical protein
MAAEGGESLTANATISLLFDGHNQAEFKKLMSTAREIVVVGADSSPDAVIPEQIATVDALGEAGRTISIYLGRKGVLNSSEVLGDARELRWQRVAEVPVNFIAVDNARVVISSHRFFESAELVSGFGFDAEAFGASGEAGGRNRGVRDLHSQQPRIHPELRRAVSAGGNDQHGVRRIDDQPDGQQTLREETADAMDALRCAPATADPHESLNGELDEVFRRWYPRFRPQPQTNIPDKVA